MTPHTLRLLAPLCALSLFVPAPSSAQGVEHARSVEEARGASERLFAAYDTADVATVLGFLQPEAMMVEGTLVLDRAGVEELLRVHFERVVRQRSEWSHTSFRALGRDVVVFVGAGDTVGNDADGVDIFKARFATTIVWVRTEHGWRIASAHESVEPS